VDLDAASLPEPERLRLQALVEQSGIEGTREVCSDRGRDLSQYEILILRPEGTASLVCDEDRVPLPARALVSFLIDRAGPLPRFESGPPAGTQNEGGR
jgi:hypothetical protein